MKAIVIIPTYNELENIKKLIPEVLNLYENLEILVVDDNSPDGTGNYVRDLSKSNSRLHIIERHGKLGLGTAYVEGFKFVIENKYDYAIQMDADFSHDPREIDKFLKLILDYDVVVGSRYVKGVNVINWPMGRLLLSYFANRYTKLITGLPLCDSTGGFKCIRREVLESLNLDKIKSNGYSFQIEVNYKAWKEDFKIYESSIVFTDRSEGMSKMSRRIVWEAIFMVWRLRFRSIFGLLNN